MYACICFFMLIGSTFILSMYVQVINAVDKLNRNPEKEKHLKIKSKFRNSDYLKI